ncbi:MAG: AEC family transporter [Myxococcales bacterium]|nr:AEC family transporter [Polyangiaceae bacterium]MDW8247851.1 AEC family transporter [Myxococcales bacterium]
MANLILLVLCFAIGAGARRWGNLPPDSHRALNLWVVYVSLPALVLRSLRFASFRPALLLGAVALWIVFLLAVVASLAARKGGLLTPREAGGMALATGLGNTAFVGLPLLEALGGSEAVAVGAVIDQFGSFVAFSFLAVPFAASQSGEKLSTKTYLGRLVRFPPMMALGAALLLRGVTLPSAVEGAIGRLADMLSPLALASVGWLWNPRALQGRSGQVAVGLLGRLLVAPAVVLMLLWLIRGEVGLVERVTVVQAAMGPMVTAVVMAAERDLEPGLGAAMLALGVPLSLVTAPLWWFALGPCGIPLLNGGSP